MGGGGGGEEGGGLQAEEVEVSEEVVVQWQKL